MKTWKAPHAQPAWNQRKWQQEGFRRNYGKRWARMAAQIRRQAVVCQVCLLNTSTEVHHLVPVKRAPHLLLEPSNLLPCCRECHERVELNPELALGKRTAAQIAPLAQILATMRSQHPPATGEGVRPKGGTA